MSKAIALLSMLLRWRWESLQVYRGGVNHCLTMSWLARRAYIRERLINQELHSERSESFPFSS